MHQIEENIVLSFQFVKQDIKSLQRQINGLNKKLEESRSRELALYKEIQKLSTKKVKKTTTNRTRSKPVAKKFLASETGEKYHVENCPFTKRINRKSKVTFTTKGQASRKGYKPCVCIN